MKEYTHDGTGNLRIEQFQSSGESVQKAGEYINDILAQYVDTPVLFLIAGGSASSVLDYVKPEYLGPDMTVTTTDDRFSTELDVNNFSILQTTSFYNSLVQSDAFCISTEPFEEETLQAYANRFEKNLREWKQDFPKGVIIALYGIGKDGHTGGMIPGLMDKKDFEAEFNNPEKLVGIFDAKTYKGGQNADAFEYPQRISTSIPFMKEWVNHAVFYMSGNQKKEVFDNIKRRKEKGDMKDDSTVDYSIDPSSVIHFMKDVVLFTDII